MDGEGIRISCSGMRVLRSAVATAISTAPVVAVAAPAPAPAELRENGSSSRGKMGSSTGESVIEFLRRSCGAGASAAAAAALDSASLVGDARGAAPAAAGDEGADIRLWIATELAEGADCEAPCAAGPSMALPLPS